MGKNWDKDYHCW